MNILITGGAGYIGTSLAPMLLQKGLNVTIIDNLMFGGDPIIPLFRFPNFTFIRGDIRDKDLLKKVVSDKDIIVHLAAIVGYPACRKDPELAESVNLDATKLLASLLSKDQLVLYGSTGSNYGSVEEVCTEETPLNPLSLYGQTKTLAEQHLMENCTTIAYRFATAFGVSPRLRLDLLINDFTYKAVSQGYMVVYESHFMRTFIHVHDIARSWLFAIDHPEDLKNDVFNVGSDEMNYSKKDICEMIAKRTGAYFHYAEIGEDADKRNYVVSYEKMKGSGFETTIPVEQGIDEMVKATEAVVFRTPYTNI